MRTDHGAFTREPGIPGYGGRELIRRSGKRERQRRRRRRITQRRRQATAAAILHARSSTISDTCLQLDLLLLLQLLRVQAPQIFIYNYYTLIHLGRFVGAGYCARIVRHLARLS